MRLVALFTVIACLTACSSSEPPKPPVEVEFEAKAAYRQLPMDPTYNRMRWVQLPSVLPTAKPSNRQRRTALILPNISFNLENGTLEEAASMLAATAHYSTYCSSLIAKRPFSFKGQGTIDEIAGQIAKLANITAVVDHNNKEIRFTDSKVSDSQGFSEKKVGSYEYRSDNTRTAL